MKRTLFILLALVLCLGLAGCGGEPASEAEDIAPPAADASVLAAPEMAYASKPLPLPEGVTEMTSVAVAGDTIYLCAGSTLYALDADGNVLRSFPLAVSDGSVAAMTAASDGTLWLMTVPAPSAVQPVSSVCHFDAEKGQVLGAFDLPATGVVPTEICADTAQERLYVSAGAQTLALDWNGNVLLQLAGQVYDLALAADGTLCALDAQPEAAALLALDFEDQRWDRALTFDTQDVGLYSGGQSHDLLADVDGTLCSLDTESLSLTPLLETALANATDLTNACALPEGRFLLEDWYGPTLYLARPAEGGGPVTITVAILNQSVLGPVVTAFNNSQDAYRVVLKNYAMEYNDQNNYYHDTAGLEHLGLDIASGDGPDILALDQLPVYQYIKNGLLEDLWPYIDADPDIDRSDLDEGMLAALETDGALYELATAVQMPALIAAPGTLDESQPVTWTGILEALGENAFAGNGADGLLDKAVCGDGSPFVDWEQNTCDFENDEFLALLALAKGAEQPKDPSTAPSILLRSVFAEQDLALNARELGLDDEVPAVLGLPGREGARYLLSPLIDFAICSQSEHKDGAWAFLRTFLTAPSTAWLGRYLTKGVQTDPSMFPEDVPADLLDRSGDGADEAFAAANGVFHSDTAAVNILREEAAPFLAGQAAAEDAAANIQNRMRLYLSERG